MSILFLLLVLLATATAAGVMVSYLIAWMLMANGHPTLIETRFRPGNLLFAGGLLIMETALLFLTVVLRPLGWLPERSRRPPGTPPRGVTPVLLLHGLFHNRACMFWLRRRLEREGFPAVLALNLPMWGNAESATETVARKVDELRITMGIEKVHLVGHSMGGMIARNYVQIRGGSDKVDRCVLLGTPNGGSVLAPLAVTPLGRCLVPGSDFLVRLNSAPLPPSVHLSTVYSRHDNLVVPHQHGRLDGARNTELTGLGHCALLYHPKALKAVVAELRQETPDEDDRSDQPAAG